jgi:predicted RNase H-like HicB family nuclease
MNPSDLQILVWKEEKHYVSQCLNVEVASFGDTKKEAVENLKEALELYFQDEHDVTNVEKPELISMPWSYA